MPIVELSLKKLKLHDGEIFDLYFSGILSGYQMDYLKLLLEHLLAGSMRCSTSGDQMLGRESVSTITAQILALILQKLMRDFKKIIGKLILAD